MEFLKFKTSIHCGSCIRAVTPYLEANEGIKKWEINVDDPDKILTVYGKELSEESIMESVREAGFSIEPAVY